MSNYFSSDFFSDMNGVYLQTLHVSQFPRDPPENKFQRSNISPGILNLIFSFIYSFYMHGDYNLSTTIKYSLRDCLAKVQQPAELLEGHQCGIECVELQRAMYFPTSIDLSLGRNRGAIHKEPKIVNRFMLKVYLLDRAASAEHQKNVRFSANILVLMF